jgi:tetratricopeptide (TPR) repeat protein
MRRRSVLLVPLLSAFAACQSARELPPGAQAWSLSGDPLYPVPLDTRPSGERDAGLAEAQRDFDRDPDNADAIVWLGRRLAYVGRFRDAIDVYTAGIRKHPEDPRLYRHRGHRYITTRQFDRAIDDLEQAAKLVKGKPDEPEPDGIPTGRNTPTSTLQHGVWYHLGLSKNADSLCSISHWLYMALRRMGKTREADAILEPIQASMDVTESRAYHRLLLMYKRTHSPEELLREAEQALGSTDHATIGYGVGNWFLYNGEQERACDVYRKILAGGHWPAFGFIAAEADLHRLDLAGQ